MSTEDHLKLARKIINMRFIQTMINERYKNKEFKIPIHLALGHEAAALTVSGAMNDNDRLILSHRNIHYQIARGATLGELLNEYLLKPEGLAGGKEGSMNLTNPARGNSYTSSILGNNLGVGLGVALSMKAKQQNDVTFIVTGDGAMEEGSFYETLLMFAAQSLPGIIIVENNQWSLGSSIEERRSPINIKLLAESTGAGYVCLQGNNVYDYMRIMQDLHSQVRAEKKAIVVEVLLSTLGDWRLKTDDFLDGKFINYHAGPAPTIELKDWPVIQENDSDPVHALTSLIPIKTLKHMAIEIKQSLMGVSK